MVLFSIQLSAQNIYKTPSGTKYHLSSCRMVENVSKKLVDDDKDRKLTPCKICKPPSRSNLASGNSFNNKAVGESTSVRCKGYTKKGNRCKHKTRLANGYCYQHTNQNSSSRATMNTSVSTSSRCGARNKSGGYCKRKVKGGGRCYQH